MAGAGFRASTGTAGDRETGLFPILLFCKVALPG